MMSATYKTIVTGDSYEELVEKAQEEVASLLGINDISEASGRARFELVISNNNEKSDCNYTAEVIARIR